MIDLYGFFGTKYQTPSRLAWTTTVKRVGNGSTTVICPLQWNRTAKISTSVLSEESQQANKNKILRHFLCNSKENLYRTCRATNLGSSVSLRILTVNLRLADAPLIYSCLSIPLSSSTSATVLFFPLIWTWYRILARGLCCHSWGGVRSYRQASCLGFVRVRLAFLHQHPHGDGKRWQLTKQVPSSLLTVSLVQVTIQIQGKRSLFIECFMLVHRLCVFSVFMKVSTAPNWPVYCARRI